MIKTKLKWNGGNELHGFNADNHKTVYDSAPAGEPTAGPTPMQVFLHALAACSSMDILNILKKRRKELQDFRVEIEGERSEDHPKIYTAIKIKYIVSGGNITDKEMKMAIDLSMNKFCSISAMIDKSKTKIEVDYEIV